MWIKLPLMAFLIVLAGCANPYKSFYKSYYPNKDPFQSGRLIPHEGEPFLVAYTAEQAEQTVRRMHETGYHAIGQSWFNAGAVNDDKMVAQAKAVKAHTVIYLKQYTDTASGVVPLTLPNTQTTYHSGTVSSYGSVGSYSGTSTTYGTTTSYISPIASVASTTVRSIGSRGGRVDWGCASKHSNPNTGVRPAPTKAW